MYLKSIKLYHGTETPYDKIDISYLNSFSEGYGLYTSRLLTYSNTYAGFRETGLSQRILNQRGMYSCTAKNAHHIVFEFDVPTNKIQDDYVKRISIIDFYHLCLTLGMSYDVISSINFNKPDFSVFNDIMNKAVNLTSPRLNLNYRKKAYVNDNACIIKFGFDFMVNHGFSVVKISQPERHMINQFYLILDNNIIEKGKKHEYQELPNYY